MTRDYSDFLPNTVSAKPTLSKLDALGWQPFFAQQTSIEELSETPPVRINEIHRNSLHVVGEDIDKSIPFIPKTTVGDWLLLNQDLPTSSRVLERKSLIKRRAPGKEVHVQLIAANIDTAFIVTSCNQDFNIARLERYVALAYEAGATPVIILTKADLCENPDTYAQEAQSIAADIQVLTLNAKSDEPSTKLAPWCKPGQTVAFLGSSGVGKSTLVNALSGTQSVATQAIREDDAKGRHTTTHRHLHFLPDGCAVLDTPGMRELQLADTESGLSDVFADLAELATQCKFNDCKHETEPGCAVNAAIKVGEIDENRLARWQKLVAEDRHNTTSLTMKKSHYKALSKTIRNIQNQNKK